jgi:phosphoserine phosphatase
MASSEVSCAFVGTIFQLRQDQSPLSENCPTEFIKSVESIRGSVRSSIRILDGGNSPQVIEIRFSWDEPIALDRIKKHPALATFEQEIRAQVVIQRDDVNRRYKRLAVFDMDSTLIQQEVIDEIARKIGVEDKVSAITERAMNGELDFEASLRERCALLRGVPSTVFEELKQVISLTPGAANLVKLLKKLGYTTAVLSGGFTPLASWLANQLGLDYAHANHLVVSDDGTTLTGELQGKIVHAERKRDLVREIAQAHHIDLGQVLVVGDGANDLPMMSVAGLGVAFNAKERVQKEAPVRLNRESLSDVAYLLGLSTEDIGQLLSA